MFPRSWFVSGVDRRSTIHARNGDLAFQAATAGYRLRPGLFKGLSTIRPLAHTHRMITKNIGMLLLAIYLIIVGIVTLTGLGIGFITGALALVAGIFILIGR